jgi:hypothetical protein
MPLYTVTTPDGLLSAQQRDVIAAELVRIHGGNERAREFCPFDLSDLSAKSRLCRHGTLAGQLDCRGDPRGPYGGREIPARSISLEHVQGKDRGFRSRPFHRATGSACEPGDGKRGDHARGRAREPGTGPGHRPGLIRQSRVILRGRVWIGNPSPARLRSWFRSPPRAKSRKRWEEWRPAPGQGSVFVCSTSANYSAVKIMKTVTSSIGAPVTAAAGPPEDDALTGDRIE